MGDFSKLEELRKGNFISDDWEGGCPGRWEGEVQPQDLGVLLVPACYLLTLSPETGTFPRGRSLPHWVPGQVP